MFILHRIWPTHFRQRPAFCALACILLLAKPLAQAGEPILMMQSGWSDELQAYQKALVELLLAETEAEYGKTELVIVHKKVTTKRSRRLIFEKKQRLINFTSDWAYAHGEGIYKANRPLFKLMNGFRRCVTSPSLAQAARPTATLKYLKTLRIGSGDGWPDNRVYEHAGIDLIIASQLSHLYAMVKEKRFDCLPLGILETSTAHPHEGTAVMDNFYIFYPLPIFINASDTSITKRIERGYDKSLASGKFDALFNQHFSHSIPNPLDTAQIVFLDNPDIPSLENNRLKAAFLDQITRINTQN